MCDHLNLPANRFESPEVEGGQSLYIEGGLQGSNTVVLVPLTTADPPDVNAPTIDHSGSSLTLAAGLGILTRLDVGVRYLHDAPALLKLKYQLVGSGRMQSRPHTVSLAVTGGIGTSRRQQQHDDLFTPLRATSKTEFLTLDGAVIAGYRMSPSLLVYASAFHSTTSVERDITQSPSSSVTPFSGDARQTGGNLGLEMKSDHLGVMLEAGYGSARYRNAVEDAVFFGVAVRLFSSRIHQ